MTTKQLTDDAAIEGLETSESRVTTRRVMVQQREQPQAAALTLSARMFGFVRGIHPTGETMEE